MMLNADVRKGGVGQMRTPADRGEGVRNGSFFADVLYGRPLTQHKLHCSLHEPWKQTRETKLKTHLV